MKVTLKQVALESEQAVIEYHTLSEDIRHAVHLLEQNRVVLIGKWEQETAILPEEDILYFESVDEKVFAYTMKRVFRMEQTLTDLEQLLVGKGFFRCSKAFIINIHKITSLQSELGCRIDATLKNGEHIVISRHYAKTFREILKEGKL